ncbi:MAG: 5-guanidino-2-oxopentanoate decarboxylase [Rhizobiaceae bacterium]
MKSIGEAFIEHLVKRNVDVVFGIPGVHTIEHYRGLSGSGILHVTPRHEQGVAFMADGYARVSGKPGVALVITGPGVTNTITAMGQARADSVPILVISGANPLESVGKGRGHLHELPDQHATLSTVAIKSFQIKSEDDLALAMDGAFKIFTSGRPGPVHIELPRDVAKIKCTNPLVEPICIEKPKPGEPEISAAVSLINSAELPVILAGGGVRNHEEGLRNLAERLDAPVVQTVNARGMMHQHELGVPASPSLSTVRKLIEASDLVLAFGTEFGRTDYDMYETGTMPEIRGLIHVDISASQLERQAADVKIQADAGETISLLLEHLPEVDRVGGTGAARAADARTAALDEIGEDMRSVTDILSAIRDASPSSIMVGDSTQPIYAGNLYYDHDHPGGWFNASTGFGALGYGIPAAIGAALSDTDARVICLTGDGGAQFSLPELMTAVDQKLPVIFIIWNNYGYGEIESSMKRANVDVVGCSPSPPDFSHIALACGMPFHRAAPESGALSELIRGILSQKGPVLLEIAI